MAAAEQPSNLDLGVGIVRTPHWLLLLVLLGLIGGAVAFSFVIKVPVMVKAQGILIPEEGLKDIVSLTSGRVKVMLVRPGDYVRKGTRVAEVEQPDLSQELREAQNQLVNSRKRLSQIKHFQQRIEKDDAELRAQEIEILKHLISSNEEHEAWLVDNLNKFKGLLKHGYITSQNLMDARVKLYETQAELIRNKNRLNALVYEADSKKIQMEREILELAIEVEEARRTVHSIRQRRLRLGFVTTPYSGMVVEQKVDLGGLVEQGQGLLSVLPVKPGEAREKAHVGLVATLFLPATEGKRAQIGMEAHVVPSTVKREEYGFMFGEVTTISAIPASPEGMMRVLKNRQLVESLSREGAPIQAKVRLDTHKDNYSGFRWSSPDGPPQMITAGSLCSAEIVTKRQPLITLVMPAIKRVLQMVIRDSEAGVQ